MRAPPLMEMVNIQGMSPSPLPLPAAIFIALSGRLIAIRGSTKAGKGHSTSFDV